MLTVVVDIFYAIMFISIGIWLLKYRRTVKSWTGSFLWAEKYIWNGGTYFIIMVTWLFLIFLGILYPFWGLELIFWVSTSAPKEI